MGKFLHERAEGALVRTQISPIKEIVAPTRFFRLEKHVLEPNQMLHLELPNGKITSDPAEMRKLAIDFYANLFSAGLCDPD